jgi:alpha-methylacyl-CoA racemase
MEMFGPLKNIRIIEIEGLGPVPFCGMVLAGLGADMIRIARPNAGPARAETGDAVVLRGRPAVTADLKNPGDVARVMELVKTADALLEGFRPGVMERLGLGPDACLAANPRLVYGRMTGWGQAGPLAARAGHDINYIALTGALHAIGKPGEPPTIPLNLIGDYGGGAMFLATGILAALLEAKDSGQGQVVDAAMTDGAAALMSLFHSMAAAGAWKDERAANLLDGGAPFYRCYTCADGKYVAVGPLEPQFFAALIRVTGIDFPLDQQYKRALWPALAAQLEQVFAGKTRDEWAAIFAPEDACVTPVLSIEEAPAHEHNQARGTFFRRADIPQAAPAPRFSRSGEVRAGDEGMVLRIDDAIARWAV